MNSTVYAKMEPVDHAGDFTAMVSMLKSYKRFTIYERRLDGEGRVSGILQIPFDRCEVPYKGSLHFYIDRTRNELEYGGTYSIEKDSVAGFKFTENYQKGVDAITVSTVGGKWEILICCRR